MASIRITRPGTIVVEHTHGSSAMRTRAGEIKNTRLFLSLADLIAVTKSLTPTPFKTNVKQAIKTEFLNYYS
jgi:hypothetical protein